MISSRQELQFFLQADRMMNRGQFTCGLKDRLVALIAPDWIMRYLRLLRTEEYYGANRPKSILRLFNKVRLHRLAVKLGFSIAPNVFGYGLVIPHYGTIVVGGGNCIGRYCVLHTSTCITAGKKKIGDALYMSAGVKVVKDIELGDGVSIGANSMVNKTFAQSNCLLGGVPAIYLKETSVWYERDDEKYKERVNCCEQRRRELGL